MAKKSGHKGADNQFKASMRTRAGASAAKLFKKLAFPKQKKELLQYTQDNKKDADYAEMLLKVLNKVPDRTYDSIYDIEREIGKAQ